MQRAAGVHTDTERSWDTDITQVDGRMRCDLLHLVSFWKGKFPRISAVKNQGGQLLTGAHYTLLPCFSPFTIRVPDTSINCVNACQRKLKFTISVTGYTTQLNEMFSGIVIKKLLSELADVLGRCMLYSITWIYLIHTHTHMLFFLSNGRPASLCVCVGMRVRTVYLFVCCHFAHSGLPNSLAATCPSTFAMCLDLIWP